jgi:hypothetical protein
MSRSIRGMTETDDGANYISEKNGLHEQPVILRSATNRALRTRQKMLIRPH